MICPNCGKESPGKFCPSCGAKMPLPEPVVNVQEVVEPLQEPVVNVQELVEDVQEPVVNVQELVEDVQEPIVNVQPPVPPESAAPGELDETAKQAETIAAAASAAIAAETVCPESAPEQPAPNQGWIPNQAAPNQGWAPNQAAPNQGWAPNQPAPNQGWAPNQPAPNQGWAPNQAAPNQGWAPNQPAPNQGWAPNQAAPNQGWAPYPNRNYAPPQSAAPQNTGAFQSMSPAEVGQTPASQLVRRLASSGTWIIATLATTLSFLLSLGYFIYNLVGNRTAATKDYVSSSIPGLLFAALFVFLFWCVYGSAANKRKEKMGSGALITMKVIFIIALVFICIMLLLTLVLGVLLLVLSSKAEIDEYTGTVWEVVLPYFNINMPKLPMNLSTLFAIAFGVMVLIFVFGIIYIAKVIKSLSTGARVIRTGQPDDRVSTFVGVFTIIGAILMLVEGLALLLLNNASRLLGGMMIQVDRMGLLAMGITFLLNAVASFFFAIVLFKFRSGMRQLGVRRGVMQKPMQ